MDATVIKLVIMLTTALIVTLGLIGVEFWTHAVRPGATISKSVVAVVVLGLLVSII
ncbi:hypothetical protein [Lacticaseibacillus hulanensis]|jgi:hypothetical protein|uniref:hypothetical protein n=1 Tax=Lacticaseibacillus hulanensis TaxID=2493111 RepID=UPI0013E2D968|nr:hypothetical protein [Lacticaseibacillus hulanensis]